MKLTRTRAVGALIGLVALAVAATALAGGPKAGLYSTGAHEPNHLSVTFTLQHNKLLSFFVATTKCKQGQPAIVEKKIPVEDDGTFEYDGKATSPLGDNLHLDVTGEFVKDTVAKGTAERKGCKAVDFKVKFQGREG